MDKPSERRKKPRIPVGGDALVQVGGEQFTATILDVAAKGIALLCPFQWSPGNKVILAFRLPNHAELVRTRATVMRCELRGGSCIWGLEFHRPDGRTQGLIEQLVRDHLTMQAKARYRIPLRNSHSKKPKPTERGEKSLRSLFRAALSQFRK